MPFHSTRQSSLYRPKQRISGNAVSFCFVIAWSIEATPISAYEQEFGAPVAVPFVCNKFSFASTELLSYKHNLSLSIKQSVDSSFIAQVFSISYTAYIPLWLDNQTAKYINNI